MFAEDNNIEIKQPPILKDKDFKTGNEYLSIPISTGLDITRNALISYNCDLGVAISGAYGTLSEIAFTLAQEKQLIAYNSWDIPKSIQVKTIDSLIEEVDKCCLLYTSPSPRDS